MNQSDVIQLSEFRDAIFRSEVTSSIVKIQSHAYNLALKKASPLENKLSIIANNVDNEKLTDSEFREFIRNIF